MAELPRRPTSAGLIQSARGLAPVIAGYFWDITGNYAIPLIMSLGFSLMGLVLALLLPSPSRRLIPHWEESLPLEARSSASP